MNNYRFTLTIEAEDEDDAWQQLSDELHYPALAISEFQIEIES